MISIGITDVIDDEFLREISGAKYTSGSQQLGRDYFRSPDFRSLQGIISSIVSSACAQPSPSESLPVSKT